MSNRNFDSRVITQRLQNQNYARNLYKNNVNGQGIINNPQNTDGTSSNFTSYKPGAQTEYFRGLLGGGETISVGGIVNIPPFPPSASALAPAPVNNAMIIEINITDTNDATMSLPLGGLGIEGVRVNWGDGTIETYTTTPIEHIYQEIGIYTISIEGSATSFGNTDGYTGNNLITKVLKWGNLGFTSFAGAFFQAFNLLEVPNKIPANVTNLNNMFTAASLFNGNISGWDTSRVTNMTYMFNGASSFNGDISNWNTINVEDMQSMFYFASNFYKDLSNWNVNKVTSANNIFCECPVLDNINYYPNFTIMLTYGC